MIIATDEAIQTAIRNEQTMTGYEIEEFACVPGSDNHRNGNVR